MSDCAKQQINAALAPLVALEEKKKKEEALAMTTVMGPQVHIKEPGGSLSVTHEIRMLGYEKRGRDR